MSSQDFAYEAFTLFGCTSLYILLSLLTLLTVLQPRISPVWAFSPFARRYSGNHCCFLFLRVLRCFSSPGSSPFSGMTAAGCRVPPFGYRRFFASLRLAVAFRCLARPSSVQCGQASSLRPSLLDLL